MTSAIRNISATLATLGFVLALLLAKWAGAAEMPKDHTGCIVVRAFLDNGTIVTSWRCER